MMMTIQPLRIMFCFFFGYLVLLLSNNFLIFKYFILSANVAARQILLGFMIDEN